MSAKKALRGWSQKAIYLFLVIWVGGLAPLIYFETYSSHRGVQRVKLSLFTESGASNLPTALRQMWTQHTEQWSPHQLNTHSQLMARNISLPGVTSSVTIFHDGYVLSIASAHFFDTSFAGRVSDIQLLGCSIWLPPPEKPPSFPQADVV